MSDEAAAIARNHSRSQGTARLVLLGIANHDSDGGSSIHMATLATYANVTLRNAQKAVERLAGHTSDCKRGCRDHLDVPEVERVVNAGGRLNDPHHERPNLYRFLLECPPRCDRTKFHRIRCSACGKPVPHDRRWVGTHVRCALQERLAQPVEAPADPPSDATGGDDVANPPSDATGGVASDTRTNTSVETEINTYVPERAREAVCHRGHALLDGASSCLFGHYSPLREAERQRELQLLNAGTDEGSPTLDDVVLAARRGTAA